MRYVSLDCEMTGLNKDTCDLLEFGAVIEDTEDMKPFDKLPRFHCYFLPPHEGETVRGEPFALQMNAEILRKIATRDIDYNYLSVNRFGNSFKKFLAENGFAIEHDRVTITPAGKNVAWDIQWLEEKTDVKKHVKFRHRVIDPSILYVERGDSALPGLSECKARAGLDRSVAHTAVEDSLDVIMLLRERIKPGDRIWAQK